MYVFLNTVERKIFENIDINRNFLRIQIVRLFFLQRLVDTTNRCVFYFFLSSKKVKNLSPAVPHKTPHVSSTYDSNCTE